VIFYFVLFNYTCLFKLERQPSKGDRRGVERTGYIWKTVFNDIHHNLYNLPGHSRRTAQKFNYYETICY
jgi:hypothetical protein